MNTIGPKNAAKIVQFINLISFAPEESAAYGIRALCEEYKISTIEDLTFPEYFEVIHLLMPLFNDWVMQHVTTEDIKRG